jgi:hypothetical protein
VLGIRDPDPKNPHVLVSRIRIHYEEVPIRILPFFEIMLAKQIFPKNKIFMTEDKVIKKNLEKNIFLHP